MPAPTSVRPAATPAVVLFQQKRQIPQPGWPRPPVRALRKSRWRPLRAVRLPEPAVASYHELDVRLAWTAAPGLEATVTGRNLLHSEHPNFGPAATRQLGGRTVLFHLSWRY